MVDILLRQADELLVAAEDGGYAQGLVGHVVALVLGERVVDEAVDALRRQRYVLHALDEAFHPQAVNQMPLMVNFLNYPYMTCKSDFLTRRRRQSVPSWP